MKEKKEMLSCPERLGKVGGQAVIEGVMMKSGERTATACRLENGDIKVVSGTYQSLRKRYKICNIPILRGFVNFIEMMVLNVKILNTSAEAFANSEDEKESRFEKWLKDKTGISLYDIVTAFAMIFGVALALALFIYLPRLLSEGIFGESRGLLRSLIEGAFKVIIFIGYLAAVSLMKDMRRVFAYHGAEHMSVACYEAGDPLTPEFAKKHTRFHPRCGTSFMFVMILLGVIAGIFVNLIPGLSNLGYVGIKLLILPLVVGVGFEYIMYAGKHDYAWVRALSAPGLWMQRLTTRVPDEQMLECALTALQCAMPEQFPDFDPTTYNRAPKKEADAVQETADGTVQEATIEDAEQAVKKATEKATEGTEEIPEAGEGKDETL